tara:strand:- start:2783 stop:3040 length:258 start_codon:yes stop_codon:yes gene_type:complete
MKINPSTKELYTDTGDLLKRLHCPVIIKWGDMKKNGPNTRMCYNCKKTVYNTVKLTDTELKQLLEKDNTACLNIDLNQDNVKVVY